MRSISQAWCLLVGGGRVMGRGRAGSGSKTAVGLRGSGVQPGTRGGAGRRTGPSRREGHGQRRRRYAYRGVGPAMPRGEYTRHNADESAALARFRPKRDGGVRQNCRTPTRLHPSSTPGMAEVRGPSTSPRGGTSATGAACGTRGAVGPEGRPSHPRRPWRRIEATRSRGGGHESE
jgi:hypothetical protein